MPAPDFGLFRDALLLRAAPARPRLFDFHVASVHQERVLGRAIMTAADAVEFWRLAGYDYVQATLHVPVREFSDAVAERGGAATHASGAAIVTGLAQFRSRRWSWQDAAEGNLAAFDPAFDHLRALAAALPPGMKLMITNGDIFTNAWELMGFEAFCEAAAEEPDLVRALMGSLAAAELNMSRRAVETAGDAAGVVMFSDDIAYASGLMLSPAFFREHLFPHLAAFARIGARAGAPMIYHSDGRLYDVLPDLAACGVKALQPLEPKSMDPLEIRRLAPGAFCLLGHVDLDLMARGTEAEVRALVRAHVARLGRDGGYLPGVSNTVPDYVRYANYRAMIEEVFACGV